MRIGRKTRKTRKTKRDQMMRVRNKSGKIIKISHKDKKL